MIDDLISEYGDLFSWENSMHLIIRFQIFFEDVDSGENSTFVQFNFSLYGLLV